MLPEGFFPEGIESGPPGILFASSLKARGLQCINTETGEVWSCFGQTYCAQSILWPEGAELSEGFDEQTGDACVHNPDETLNGMAFDQRTNYLWVAGRNRGTVHRFLYADDMFTLQSSYRIIQLGYRTLINDLVIGDTAVFITDSTNNLMYKIPIASDGTVADDVVVEYILLGESSRDEEYFISPFGDNYVPGASGTWTTLPDLNWNGLLALSTGHIMINNKATGQVVIMSQDVHTYPIAEEGLGVEFLKDCMHTNSSLCPVDHTPVDLIEVALVGFVNHNFWDGMAFGDTESIVYAIDQPSATDEGHVYKMEFSIIEDLVTEYTLNVTETVEAGLAGGVDDNLGLNNLDTPTTLTYMDGIVYAVNGRFAACSPLPSPPWVSVLAGGPGAENCPGVEYWVTVDIFEADTITELDATTHLTLQPLSLVMLLLLGVFM